MDISIGSSSDGTMSSMGMMQAQKPDNDEMSSDLVTELDSDGDGMLSQAEMAEASDDDDVSEVFSALDTDGDGYVSEDELADGMDDVDPTDSTDSTFSVIQDMMDEAGFEPPAEDPGQAASAYAVQSEDYTSQVISSGLSMVA